MCVRQPKAMGEDGNAPAAAPRIQNPAASKMLSLVDNLEEELFAAEARRHDAEVKPPSLLTVHDLVSCCQSMYSQSYL